MVAMITWFSDMSEHVLEGCRIVHNGGGNDDLVIICYTPLL